ncbi:MAG: transglutaminase-like domain-containing protein [Fimbriimonas sp.]|nr:transglutaminase-like domain-containing protein [Fimbriimonas sp.]
MLALACFILLSFPALQDLDSKENPVFPQFYHAATHGPTLSEFTLRAPVKVAKQGDMGVVSFPAPSSYSGQLVVSLSVSSDPPSALKSWVWKDRPDHLNSVIEAKVAPGGKGAWISYTALVLVPSEPVYRTMSNEFKPWLGSTACVQSADPEIASLAKKLAVGALGRDEYVHKVVMWVAMNQGQKGEAFSSLDAKRGLKCGGSCTNRANLCAALLRARGIPARTISHMPTWFGGKFYQHWLTEYWTDSGNWAMVEPTIGVKHPARNTVIVLAISSPQDENKAFDPQHLRLSMPGSPYLSLAELSPELFGADLAEDDAINEIHLLKTFPDQSEQTVMTEGSLRSQRVIAAARVGRNDGLDKTAVIRAVAKSPSDFIGLLARQ